MDSFWKNKRILVIGGTGFVGSHLVERLIMIGAKVSVMASLANSTLHNLEHILSEIEIIKGDCTDFDASYNACKNKNVVFNLATFVRGIEYNRSHPATLLTENLLIETTVIKAVKKANIDRYVIVSSACVYPSICSVPTSESEGFLDEPDFGNAGYGWAKRMAEKLGMYYYKEFNMPIAIARPYNCYGPRDRFDTPQNVVPALIKRIVGGENPVTVWGSGNQTRAFLYIRDFIDGLLLVGEKYAVADPVNLGSNEEITIKKLVAKIQKLTGSNAEVVFDTSKPDGSPRRKSNNTKAEKAVGFIARTTLNEGLKKTIQWYTKQSRSLDKAV